MNDKKYKRWVAMFGGLIVILVGAFLLMLFLDTQNFKKAAEKQNNQIIKNLSLYNINVHPEPDLFLGKAKEELLRFSENSSGTWAYGAIVNHDNILKVTAGESVRLHADWDRMNPGKDYWCDAPAFLQWLKEEAYPNVSESGASYKEGQKYQAVNVEDAYFYWGNMFIPGRVVRSIYTIGKKIPGKEGPGKRSWAVDCEQEIRDFSDLMEAGSGYEHVFARYTQGAVSQDIDFQFDMTIVGIAENSPVFDRVNEKCERKKYHKKVGDVEVLFVQHTGVGSYELRTFSGTNVIVDYQSRYYGVLGALLMIGLLFLSFDWILQKNQMKMQEEKENYRRNLMNSLAHDLKTPLTAMSGYAQNLMDNVYGEKKEHYAKAILENADYMNDIIATVLLFSESEAMEVIQNPKEVELVGLSKRLWEKYKLLAENKGMRAVFDGEYVVLADMALIGSAMDNLLTNAIHHGKEGSEIWIKGTPEEFRISNPVSGEMQGDIQNLWKPFVKGDGARSRRKGSGLGLSIVKNVMTLHKLQADISCENNLFQVKIKR